MDPLFVGVLVIGAVVVAIVTFVDHPLGNLTRGRSDRGFNCCERCHRPLRVEPGNSWRLVGTCTRCGDVQEWAARNP
ncbi:MAG TPA: hypothetical protein VGJ67_05330, partial [Actinomycetota bacterium]